MTIPPIFKTHEDMPFIFFTENMICSWSALPQSQIITSQTLALVFHGKSLHHSRPYSSSKNSSDVVDLFYTDLGV